MPYQVISGFESTPPPPPLLMTSHSKKCPGDLEKFPDLDLGSNFRICEYTPPPWWRHIREFLDVVNMNEIWRNMSKIWRNMWKIWRKKSKIWRNISKICKNMWKMWRNMKEIWRYMKKYEGISGKYERICQKYEEICLYIGFGTSICIWALGLEKIPSTAFIQSLGLGKIPNSPPLNGSWDLEKFQALPLYRLV